MDFRPAFLLKSNFHEGGSKWSLSFKVNGPMQFKKDVTIILTVKTVYHGCESLRYLDI